MWGLAGSRGLQVQPRLHQREADPAPQPRPGARAAGSPRSRASCAGAQRACLAPNIADVAIDQDIDHPEVHDAPPAASVVIARPGLRRSPGIRRWFAGVLARSVAPRFCQHRWLSPARIAASRTAAARGNNRAGPKVCTTTAPTATEIGNTPKLASISRPVSLPSRSEGAHRWKTVIITTLPKPLHSPHAATAAPM